MRHALIATIIVVLGALAVMMRGLGDSPARPAATWAPRPGGKDDPAKGMSLEGAGTSSLDAPPPDRIAHVPLDQVDQVADSSPQEATAFIARGGLELLQDPERGRVICRKALEPSLAQLGDLAGTTIRDSVLEGRRESILLMKVLERGPYQGYSHEELAAIRNAYQPQLGMAADEYVQALDNAMRAIWREQREQAWRADGLDPGLGHFDGESKPAYTRGSHAGPWCFRVVVWKEEHPELQLAQDRLQTIRNALLSDQLEYLEGFKGK